MNKEMKVRSAVIYSFSLISLSIYFAVYNILAYFSISPEIYLGILSLVSLLSIPLFYREKKVLYFSLITLLSFLLALGVMLSPDIQAPGDLMDAFILLLVASLMAAGVNNTFKFLYSGLSFYLVGVFLLLAFAAIKITIFLATLLDYYINCLGENCTPYPFDVLPSFILVFLVLPAIYPYFAQSIFRRELNDKEGS